MNIEKGFRQYQALKKSMYQEGTNEHHRRIIAHAITAFDSINVRKLKKLDLNKGYQMIEFLKKNTRNGNNSINKIIRYVKKVMLHYNVATSFQQLTLLKCENKPFKRFYHEDLKLIIDYVKLMNYSQNSIVYRAAVMISLDSGIRKTELLNIRIKNIDFPSNQIYLEETKTGKLRYAPFSDFSKKIIKVLIELDPTRNYLMYNFIKKRPLSQDDLKLFYRRLKNKLGIDRIHTHRFRKTFGSLLVENGMPIESLQSLWNHSKITTTMIYLQFHESKALKSYKEFSNWNL